MFNDTKFTPKKTTSIKCTTEQEMHDAVDKRFAEYITDTEHASVQSVSISVLYNRSNGTLYVCEPRDADANRGTSRTAPTQAPAIPS